MHRTGTQAGDGAEVASVVDVVAPVGQRKQDHPLYVGLIKPNIGHGEASARVASLMKAILMLEKGIIPPHVGIKTEINGGFPDLDVRISTASTSFEPSLSSKRTILVNSFSAAGGGNTTLLLQEPPTSTRVYRDPRPAYAITVSGYSPLSLDNNLKLMVEYMDANPSCLPGDLSYTTMARHMHQGLRVTVTGETTADIKHALERKEKNFSLPSPATLRSVVSTRISIPSANWLFIRAPHHECVAIGELLAILDNATGAAHGWSCQGPDIPQGPTAKRCANGPTRSTDSWTQTGSASKNRNIPFTKSVFSFGEAYFSAQGVTDVDPPPGLLFESPDGMHKPSESILLDSQTNSHEPSAKVILLQRRSNLSSNKQLFLFPDGSGSPASHAQFENLSPDIEVYGLVCPYLKIPQAETNGLAATVGVYISAIEYQPHGPYHLGSWSIGGVYVYEASNRLVQVREYVALLLLIDSLGPSVFPPINSRLIKFFEVLGVFDQMPSDVRGRSPFSKREQALNHFRIATKDLSNYKPVRAITREVAPKVFVFWARNGVCEER
ncbi:hypothetical protein N8T08_001413 [Aspergillus melleus]|uniref:Uncharacterized protein n=1 Tax=Aspergillus melleus TaxID=138277 RepID=A0ACC3B9K5_9EURO|nr:hypothetical protein N8T08_001413 [Aspergillus melleus]